MRYPLYHQLQDDSVVADILEIRIYLSEYSFVRTRPLHKDKFSCFAE
jgi:hypothetical protein